MEMEFVTKTKVLRPMHDRVVIRRVEAETMAAAGIYKPEKVMEKSAEGIVLAIGPGKMLEDGRRIPITVTDGESLKVGDHVLFAKYGGLDYSLNLGDELTILREDEILGKVEIQEQEQGQE